MSSPAARKPDPYHFSVGRLPADHFEVHTVRGREALSKPFAFRVTVTSPALAADELENLALGERAALTLRTGGPERVVSGVIDAVRAEGLRDGDRVTQATFRLVPTLALLRHQHRSRIFQDVRVDEVVTQVLAEAGIQSRWQLTRRYPTCSYVTQYDETDLAFVTRILLEAGIFYWCCSDRDFTGEAFDPSADDVMVMADDASAYPPVRSRAAGVPTLSCAPVTGVAFDRSDRITSFASSRRIRPAAAEYREFDPTRPRLPLVSRAGVAAPRGLETYEHDGHFLFPDAEELQTAAERIRQRKRRRSMTSRGVSGCNTLAPGHRFAIDGIALGSGNREQVVVSVEHQGRVASGELVYENTFESVPSSVSYLPNPGRRRNVQSLLTATVVGPPGEDIHVDGMGRIKVHFHWDRRGPGSDTSCWIRVVHQWAGAGFGHQFIPRVGMEVAVCFDRGDPDKPIVVGSLYNGTHPPPFAVPGNKTQSGLRTQSTPGGMGHNELMFDDAANHERVYLRAQRDLDEEVLRNHSVVVKNDATLRVESSQYQTVLKNASCTIGGSREESVRGDVSIHHAGGRVDTVDGTSEQRVRGDRTVRIEGADRLEVRGDSEERYQGDRLSRVLGNYSLIVGEHSAPRAMTLRAEGFGVISTEDTLELTSNTGISLRCGKSVVRIGADGIELTGEMIRIQATDAGLQADDSGLKLASAGVHAHLSDKVVVMTEKATFAMGSEVKIEAEKIRLNSPVGAGDDEVPPPPQPTDIELFDTDGNILAEQRFVIDLDEGSQRSGVTDKNGRASLELANQAKIRFPDLLAGAGRSNPSAPWMPHVVAQGEHLDRLAVRAGSDPETVWSHERNRSLAAFRNKDMLCPGDTVFLPRDRGEGLDISPGTKNTYRLAIPTTPVKLVLDLGRRSIANKPFEVRGVPGAKPIRGVTTPEGAVSFRVPVWVRRVELRIPEVGIVMPVSVGDLDPIEETSGVTQRLRSLGYLPVLPGLRSEAALAETLAAALSAFQRAVGIPPHGRIDADTRAALVQVHKS